MESTFHCIDAHTCGNPVRVVREGGPELFGATMSERRQHFLAEYDWIRTGLMFEPRGHDIMSGSIVYPPIDPANDAAVLFIETSGCLPMCGHGTIGTVTVILEQGMVTPKTPGVLRLEVPAGLVTAHYQETDGKIDWVRIINIPSYLDQTGLTVDAPGLGELVVDVAYGGNFYAIVDPQKNFADMRQLTAGEIIQLSPILRQRLNEKYSFSHPDDPTINKLSHLLWTGTPTVAEATARNAVFYGDKAIDRSPCGTGTSARMAQWAAKGKLQVGDEFIHESIIGSLFRGRVESATTVGNKDAIIPSIAGWAKVTGFNTVMINDDDPYAHGFSVV